MINFPELIYWNYVFITENHTKYDTPLVQLFRKNHIIITLSPVEGRLTQYAYVSYYLGIL